MAYALNLSKAVSSGPKPCSFAPTSSSTSLSGIVFARSKRSVPTTPSKECLPRGEPRESQISIRASDSPSILQPDVQMTAEQEAQWRVQGQVQGQAHGGLVGHYAGEIKYDRVPSQALTNHAATLSEDRTSTRIQQRYAAHRHCSPTWSCCIR